MLTKETIIERARENGATIRRNEDTELEIVSSNGRLITTYFFKNDGSFEWTNNWVK
jgi:hypothetical protein